MIHWKDHGLTLHKKALGEDSSIVIFLTHQHGCYRGLLSPSSSSSTVNPGSLWEVTWKGRSEEHLGYWSLEPMLEGGNLAQEALPLHLFHLSALVIRYLWPEQVPHPEAYELLYQGIPHLAHHWGLACAVHIEGQLAQRLGYGEASPLPLTGQRTPSELLEILHKRNRFFDRYWPTLERFQQRRYAILDFLKKTYKL